MTFFLQHGYGKGDKIDSLASTTVAQAVVLSPTDEDFGSLRATADNARRLGLQALLDPQSYIYSARPPGLGRNHPSHGLDFVGMTWSQAPAETARQVAAVASAQRNVNPDGLWIAPSALQSAFDDVWTPLSIQMARTAADSWGPDRTLATVAIDENALSSRARMDDWLDIVTTLDVHGFYIVVQRSNTGYPPVAWPTDRLANLLSLIYTLSEINGFDVWWGYADSEGLLGLAAGANEVGAGWSFGLRQFSTAKWIPSTGGKPAIIRVPLARLWSSIRAAGEAEDIYDSSLRIDAFSGANLRRFPTGNFGALTRTEAQSMYLEILGSAAAILTALPTLSARLDYLEVELARAATLHGRIAAEGIVLEARYRPRVTALLESVRLFRAAEGL